jgi:hypothetical protein
MRHASIFALCLAALLANTTAASASTRLYCTCKTGPKTVLQHNNACEYHYKKPFKAKLLGGGKKPATFCTTTERKSFKAVMCKRLCSGTL